MGGVPGTPPTDKSRNIADSHLAEITEAQHMAEPTGGCHHGNPSTGFKALVSGFDDKCNEGEEEEEEEEEVCPRLCPDSPETLNDS